MTPYGGTGQEMSGHEMSGHEMSGYGTSGYGMSGYGTSGYGMSGSGMAASAVTGSPVWNTIGVATVVGAGLVGGLFFAFSTFVGRGLRLAPAGDAVAVMQAINVAAVRPPLMLALFGTGVLAVAAAVHAVRAGAGAGWLGVTGAALYWVGTIGTTIVWNVPRNDRLAGWDPQATSSASWLSWLSGWEAGNHVRTVTSLAAAVLLAIGTARGWSGGGAQSRS